MMVSTSSYRIQTLKRQKTQSFSTRLTSSLDPVTFTTAEANNGDEETFAPSAQETQEESDGNIWERIHSKNNSNSVPLC